MSESIVMGFLRKNWHLLLVFVVVVAAIPVTAIRQDSGKSEPLAEMSEASLAMTPTHARQIQPVEPRVSAQDKVRETIASHQRRLDADPTGEEAPALLNAMGNLYRQRLSDYAQAASCFELLIDSFPNTPNIREAYLQLVFCYERMGDEENRRRILRRMMNDFPPESEEYLYASQQLGH